MYIMSELTTYVESMQLEINDLKAELKNYQDLLKLIFAGGVFIVLSAYLAVLVR